VICLIAFIFAGLFQVSQLFAAREILSHAAARGARAKTVGFNWWMVEKSIRVASIPNAGLMTVPDFRNIDTALENMVATLRPGALWERVMGIVPSSSQLNIERARIPEYMDTFNDARDDYVLGYTDWNSVRGDHAGGADGMDPFIRVRVTQNYPLRMPAHRAFYAADTIRLRGESQIENYYPLYLDDQFW